MLFDWGIGGQSSQRDAAPMPQVGTMSGGQGASA